MVVQVAVAVTYCLLSSGIVFGYAALKPILIHEGVYSEYCSSQGPAHREKTCYEQEIRYHDCNQSVETITNRIHLIRLNFMFAASAVAINVCALPVGTILDRYGPRISGMIGSGFLAIGALILAFATELSLDGHLLGYLLLALGGPFVFIPSFQLSNAFPNHSGFILALLTGAFDSSSALFLVYRLIYTASGSTFTPRKFFLLYLIVPIFVLISQTFLMPSDSYKSIGELNADAETTSNREGPHEQRNGDEALGGPLREDQHHHRASNESEITPLLKQNGGDEQQQQEEKKKAISGVWGALHGRSAYEQIKTPWFILMTLFTVFQLTRINYFLATIRPQYEYLLDSYALARHVNHVFDVALPVGGILSVPVIGLLLDNVSTPAVLGLIVFIVTIVGILGVLPFVWAAYANIAIFVLYRPLYYTAVSDYAAKVFGFQTFGKVYGLIFFLAGVLNFSQSALDAATYKIFGGNPVPVNVIMMAIVLIIGSTLVGYVWYKSRSIAREELEEEAEDTPEISMPSTTGNRSRI